MNNNIYLKWSHKRLAEHCEMLDKHLNEARSNAIEKLRQQSQEIAQLKEQKQKHERIMQDNGKVIVSLQKEIAQLKEQRHRKNMIIENLKKQAKAKNSSLVSIDKITFHIEPTDDIDYEDDNGKIKYQNAVYVYAQAEVSYSLRNVYPKGHRRIEWLKSGGLVVADYEDAIKETKQEQLEDLKNHLKEFGISLANFKSKIV